MTSAGILMSPGPAVQASPASAGGAQPSPPSTGFDQALATAQAGAAGECDATALPAAVVSGLLARVATADAQQGAGAEPDPTSDSEPDSTAAAGDAGAAAILAQMLAGSAPAPRSGEPPAAEESVVDAATPRARPPVIDVAPDKASADVSAERHAGPVDGGPGSKVDDALAAVTLTVPDKAPSSEAPAGSPAAPAAINTAQAAVQAAASALRDVPAQPAPPPTVHAALREPVGSARWADELGNRLVLMSVRGQQQGSLTLTPEHLGPVEVQISVSRDTANVWFGAQHADTRAALADAMPRLRELLASSGLSLGQAGVSEQAPREGFAAQPPRSGADLHLPETERTEASAPTWRVWRPGLIDTYA